MLETRAAFPTRGAWLRVREEQSSQMRRPLDNDGNPTFSFVQESRRGVLADMRAARALHAEGYYSEEEFQRIRGKIVRTMVIARARDNADPSIAEHYIEEARRHYQGRTGEFNFNSPFTNYA